MMWEALGYVNSVSIEYLRVVHHLSVLGVSFVSSPQQRLSYHDSCYNGYKRIAVRQKTVRRLRAAVPFPFR